MWSLKVEGPIQMCVWRAMLEKLLSRLNLERRGVLVVSNLCLLCKKVKETTQHVLINCDVAQKVWQNCNRWIRVSSVRHNKIVN